jgi:predicted ATPase
MALADRLTAPLLAAHFRMGADMHTSANSTMLSCMGEAIMAIETTGETWFEAEVHRIAGEIALKSPRLGAAEAAVHFQHALSVARERAVFVAAHC